MVSRREFIKYGSAAVAVSLGPAAAMLDDLVLQLMRHATAAV